MGIDQAHEQNNAIVKGDGGAVGLFTSPTSLQKWLICGPEISELIHKFEDRPSNTESDKKHHEQSPSFQIMFVKKVSSLKEVITSCGNPFLETGKEVFSLENLGMSEESIQTIMTIEKSAKSQYEEFVKQRIASNNMSLYEKILKNNFLLFSKRKCPSKKINILRSLKNDVNLFSKLFIICTSRNLDMDNFFSFENHPFPPSLATDGHIRRGNKSDFLKILETVTKSEGIEQEHTDDYEDIFLRDKDDLLTYDEFCLEVSPTYDNVTSADSQIDETLCVVYDGPALVHILQPKTEKTFSDYAKTLQNHLLADIQKLKARRVDVVWDTYQTKTIKSYTRECRGTGERRQVRENTILPKKWQQFLKNSNNKTELFSFLAQSIVNSSCLKGIEVYSTVGSDVISNENVPSPFTIENCNHEEADSRIFVHVLDAVKRGHNSISIQTVDTDVTILAVSFFFHLSHEGLSTLFVNFGTGKHYRRIPVHDIAKKLGEKISVSLRGFHAFSGCDSTSFFSGRGKSTMWKRWIDFPEVTEAFWFLSHPQQELPDSIFNTLQRYLITCYSVTSESLTVNEARLSLFTTFNRTMENIPPTADALKMHTLRSCYQAGQKWGQLKSNIELSDISRWGWSEDEDGYYPVWITQPEVSEALREFVNCQCKNNCSEGSCKCCSYGLVCTRLCKNCKGKCQNK